MHSMLSICKGVLLTCLDNPKKGMTKNIFVNDMVCTNRKKKEETGTSFDSNEYLTTE